MDAYTQSLLEKARDEIIRIKLENKILNAKVDTFDLFTVVLHSQPAQRQGAGYQQDIAVEIANCLERATATKPKRRRVSPKKSGPTKTTAATKK